MTTSTNRIVYHDHPPLDYSVERSIVLRSIGIRR
jgi:hypothetical protein